MTGKPNAPFLPGLELLRGLAALAVCVGHVRAYLLPPFRAGGYATWEQPLYFLTAHGDAAVWVFFVLSGYLVGGSVLRAHAAGTWAWPDYLWRRGVRLWMVLLPALAVTYLCDTWRGDSPVATAGAMAARADFPHDGLTLLGNICFLQDLVVAPYGSNTALWSLAYEFWFYLLFPLLLGAAGGGGSGRRCASALLAAGILWLLGPRGWWLAMPWATGAALAWLVQHRPAQGMAWPRAWPWVGLGAALTALPFLPSAAKPLAMPVVTIAMAVLVWSEGSRTVVAEPRFGLGAISYTLYAMHMPLAVVVTSAVAGPWSLVAGPLRWISILLVTGALLVLTVGLWWLFERRTDEVRAAMRKWLRACP
jgi:peptidoglycan/LPS O-acetylase OafA/YrhL